MQNTARIFTLAKKLGRPTDMTKPVIELPASNKRTRPGTRPIPVADGWAGAEMRVFALSDLIITDQRTNRRMDKASYRVASLQWKMCIFTLINSTSINGLKKGMNRPMNNLSVAFLDIKIFPLVESMSQPSDAAKSWSPISFPYSRAFTCTMK